MTPVARILVVLYNRPMSDTTVCAKCNRLMGGIKKWYQCTKCKVWFCPSCMDRFCLFCKGAVREIVRE